MPPFFKLRKHLRNPISNCIIRKQRFLQSEFRIRLAFGHNHPQVRRFIGAVLVEIPGLIG